MITNFVNEHRNDFYYTFERFNWNLNNAPQRDTDERTGLTSYYFKGDSWLNAESNFGTPFTVSFRAAWGEFRAWSRIMDFGMAAGRENILIANEGGSRNLIFHTFTWGNAKVIRCPNMIDDGSYHQYAIVFADNGDRRIYKNG
jgi:hypothetical protein